jgi:REP element-mobilizing transposase RayT
VAAQPHDRTLREAAKRSLKYPAVQFDGRQALAISRGFAAAIVEHGYRMFACSILPDHVHVVVARCDRPIERVVTHMKVKATLQLNSEHRHPLGSFIDRRGIPPTPRAAKCWKCYLDDNRDIARAIRYVEANPAKEGKRHQQWSFVVPWHPTDTL